MKNAAIFFQQWKKNIKTQYSSFCYLKVKFVSLKKDKKCSLIYFERFKINCLVVCDEVDYCNMRGEAINGLNKSKIFQLAQNRSKLNQSVFNSNFRKTKFKWKCSRTTRLSFQISGSVFALEYFEFIIKSVLNNNWKFFKY